MFNLRLKTSPDGYRQADPQHSDELLTVATFRSWRGWAAIPCTGPGDT